MRTSVARHINKTLYYKRKTIVWLTSKILRHSISPRAMKKINRTKLNCYNQTKMINSLHNSNAVNVQNSFHEVTFFIEWSDAYSMKRTIVKSDRVTRIFWTNNRNLLKIFSSKSSIAERNDLDVYFESIRVITFQISRR